jgi:biopolymer transport protein ExbB
MIVERFSFLKKRIKHSKKRQAELETALRSQDYSKLETMVTDLDEVEDKAIHLSLEHFKKYKESGVEEIFKYIYQSEKPKYEKFLGFLATVGSNGPYIGLFGTVLGIMKAFNDMNGSSGGGASVMSGISSALIATAAGLMVAIPAVLAFNFYSRQVKTIFTNLESCKELLFLYERTQKEGK